MNTKYLKSTATILVRAQDSNSVAPASTQKIFVKRFESIEMSQWSDMVDWCYNNLYHGGYYEPMWHHQYPSFYFTDEKEYTLFLLRWS
jgi:hypothetical protein